MSQYQVQLSQHDHPYGSTTLRFATAEGALRYVKKYALNPSVSIQIWKCVDFRPWEVITGDDLALEMEREHKEQEQVQWKEEEIQFCITQYYQDRRPVYEPCGTPLINQVKPTVGEVLKMSNWRDNLVTATEVLAKGGDGGYMIVNTDEDKVKNPGGGFYLYNSKENAIKAAKHCIKQAKKYDEEANYFIARVYGVAAVGQPVPEIDVQDFETHELPVIASSLDVE